MTVAQIRGSGQPAGQWLNSGSVINLDAVLTLRHYQPVRGGQPVVGGELLTLWSTCVAVGKVWCLPAALWFNCEAVVDHYNTVNLLGLINLRDSGQHSALWSACGALATTFFFSFDDRPVFKVKIFVKHEA